MARAAPFTWDELADNSLRLPVACAPAAPDEFYVRHSTRRTATGPLGVGFGMDGEPVTHTLYLSGCERFLAASTARIALGMAVGSGGRNCGLARSGLACRRRRTTSSGARPCSTRWRRALYAWL